jgi:probable addiction module antidote protein
MNIDTSQFREFDIANYIETAQDANGYLNASLDLGINEWLKALGDIAKSQGMSEFAKQTGLNRENLYKSLQEGGNPTIKTIEKILDVLDMKIQLVPKNSNAIK